MTFWGIATAILMVVAAVVSFLPLVPGPLLVWGIALVYAFANGFTQVGGVTVFWMTALMLVGSTADYWTPFFGLQAEQSLSFGTFVVSTIGAIVGTFVIPIPVVGTFLGAALAVIGLVRYQKGDWQRAVRAGRGILKALIASFLVEFATAIGITMVFVYSLLLR